MTERRKTFEEFFLTNDVELRFKKLYARQDAIKKYITINVNFIHIKISNNSKKTQKIERQSSKIAS